MKTTKTRKSIKPRKQRKQPKIKQDAVILSQIVRLFFINRIEFLKKYGLGIHRIDFMTRITNQLTGTKQIVEMAKFIKAYKKHHEEIGKLIPEVEKIISKRLGFDL